MPAAEFAITLHVEDVAAARAELEAMAVAFAADTIDSGVCRTAPFAWCYT